MQTPQVRLRDLSPGAFTLIELLVVIGIIVLLAAFALPAINSAMLSAKSAESLSNLKQTGVLVANYAAENNNRLPLSAYWPSTYVFQNILTDFFPELKKSQYNPSAKLYLSPIFYDPVLRGKNEHPWGSFGVNSAVMLDSNRYKGGNANGVGMPFAMITNPSQKVIYVSAIEPGMASTWGTDGEVFARKGFDPSYGPDPRYGGKAGALFADGHVEKLDVKNMDEAKRRALFTLDAAP
jgi:prepilin-type processing-associated H-X9-DG protein/prepilin-type N-terminal cleavage/methylation domain-containing protein